MVKGVLSQVSQRENIIVISTTHLVYPHHKAEGIPTGYFIFFSVSVLLSHMRYVYVFNRKMYSY